MSEQVSISTEDFESTSQKLDSILDRLNALGQSAAKIKNQAPPVLQSVPDLPDDDQLVMEADAPTVANETPLVAEAAAPVTEDLSTHEAPSLGLVPPTLDDEIVVPELSQDIPDITALDNPRGAEQPLVAPAIPESLLPAEPFQPIDAGDEIESVTVLDDAAAPLIDTAPAVEETITTDVVEPVSPVVDEPTPFDPWAIEEAPSTEADTEQAFAETSADELGVPAVEPSIVPPEVPEATAHLDAPVEFDIPEIPDAPDIDAAADAVDIDTAPAPDVAVASAPDLFEATAEPAIAPTAPTSIFGSSQPATDTTETIDTPAADATDGWVSHHDTPPADTEALEVVPSVESSPFDAVSEAAIPSPFETVAAAKPQSPFETVAEQPVPSPFDAVSEAPEVAPVAPAPFVDPAPMFFDQDANEAAASVEMATEVEDTLSDLAAVQVVEPSLMPTDHAVAELAADGEAFQSDDDLPLPDFTGVYNETEGEGTEKGGVASRIEGLSVRREELDKLRPSDDLGEKVAQLEETRSRISMTTIVCFLVMLVLAFLVWSWFSDASAVEEIRQGVNSVFEES